MEGRGRGVRIPGSLEGGAHCVAQQDPLCATVQLTSSHALVLRAHMKGTLTTFSGRITQGAVVALSATIQDAATAWWTIWSEAVVSQSNELCAIASSSQRATTELSIQDKVVATLSLTIANLRLCHTIIRPHNRICCRSVQYLLPSCCVGENGEQKNWTKEKDEDGGKKEEKTIRWVFRTPLLCSVLTNLGSTLP